MRACVGALCEGDNRRLKKAALLSHALKKSSIVTASQRPASNSSSATASADRPPRRAVFPPAFSASSTTARLTKPFTKTWETHHLGCCPVLPPANPLKNRLNTLTYYYIHSIIALNNKSCLYTLINHNKPLYTVTYAYIPQISSNFYSSQRKVKNHNHSKRSANVSINLSLFVCQKNFHPLVHCSPTTLHLFYTKGCHALLACGLTSSSPQRVHFTHNRRPKTKEPPISLSCPTFSFSILPSWVFQTRRRDYEELWHLQISITSTS